MASSFCLVALFAFLIGCLATGTVWEVQFEAKASDKSKFYVLNNWKEGNGVYNGQESAPFPALQTSDTMLKTMGILRESATWAGVRLGNLFRRPKANALFLLDGLSDSVNLESLSEQSYPVDQTGLTGMTSGDEQALFVGDNILTHFVGLFDGLSLSLRVSLSDDVELSEKDALISSVNGLFDLTSPVDQEFLKSVLSIRDSVKKISSKAAADSAPDVYLFSFSGLRALGVKYSSDSEQMKAAVKIMSDTVEKVTQELKRLYDGDIVVQALVLQWEYSDVSDEQVRAIKNILEAFNLNEAEIDSALKGFPSLNLPEKLTSSDLALLCTELGLYIESQNGRLAATQCDTSIHGQRIRRDIDFDLDETYSANSNTTFGTVKGRVESRSENFSAIFLIIFATMVPLILSLFAISWAMWNMDPGSDSVIYRNTDPVGIKLE
ncbi:PREDICTED: renin receptor-like [Amphimedon queenslandica]|uniref:Uncharacterized protein n=1 Tax=Amphimedon queenslandica TaxID=400682 RepID=A0A1X7VS32_AMPQE|nr:PREDICTED: renin receptor-like [Amphimedon queenslandica]|eukprot:XP_003383235.1 PREDICTED: renin receptor-like [Amphimedon queenslandica]